MGGRQWAAVEENHFWSSIIPLSPKGLGHTANTHDWDKCAEMMATAFGSTYRTYNAILLCKYGLRTLSLEHSTPTISGLTDTLS